MLKRYLEMSEANAEEIDQMSFSSLIRTGSELGCCRMDGISGRNIAQHELSQTIF